ncbi:putative SKP1/BTB/POZ domain, NPH3 domain-containing protein [Lupinus albus]|uniref:Putative SKP1/BTB/POZ domain, NPH3 domain-containing protein n=1 Tax=Lupinus albus TaxID=3870 RepID=A0A6A4R133_LUPAL|nr:putative SKP1/BTB/POZ domain, NPH3 domain-containing protein [Lupinus albus]
MFWMMQFPLLCRSGLLKKLIADSSNKDGSSSVLELHDVPGGDKIFNLVTRFCYGVKIEVTASNVVSLRCASEYLQMNENYGEGNLVSQTESFLNEVLSNWSDTIKALQTCDEVKQISEDIHIVSRCIDSLAMKVCSGSNMFNRPKAEGDSPQNQGQDPTQWNGISSKTKLPLQGDDWYYEDVSLLSLSLYKRFVLAIEAKGMKPESVVGSLIFYVRRFVPLMNRQSSFNDKNNVKQQGTSTTSNSTISEVDQKLVLEEIAGLLPNKKGVTPSESLFRLLRAAMILHASQSCIDNLEKRIGSQLDQVELVDLLIPNMSYSPTTAATSPSIIEEVIVGADTLKPMTMVAILVDAYLAEMALDVNLKLPKFHALASAIPDYARPLDDALYHAIDVYLEAHPWLVDSEREQFCRVMNVQKLSLEASTHAAQNERLPIRVIVQVLFFEQLRLRTSISTWLFVVNVENSQNPNGNLGFLRSNNGQQQGHDHNLRDRVKELENECLDIRKELKKLAKTKKSWNFLSRMFFTKSSSMC